MDFDNVKQRILCTIERQTGLSDTIIVELSFIRSKIDMPTKRFRKEACLKTQCLIHCGVTLRSLFMSSRNLSQCRQDLSETSKRSGAISNTTHSQRSIIPLFSSAKIVDQLWHVPKYLQSCSLSTLLLIMLILPMSTDATVRDPSVIILQLEN